MITFDDIQKLDIRLGAIRSAEKVEGADRLLHFSVDCGEAAPRSIVSGIAEYYPDPEVLVGRLVPVVVNIEPREIRGVKSEGMILYAIGEGFVETLGPHKMVPPGTSIH